MIRSMAVDLDRLIPDIDKKFVLGVKIDFHEMQLSRKAILQ